MNARQQAAHAALERAAIDAVCAMGTPSVKAAAPAELARALNALSNALDDVWQAARGTPLEDTLY